MRFEPVINAQIVGTLAAALLTTLVAFNVPITEDQRNALLALVAAVSAIFWGTAVVARNNVYPEAKVDKLIEEAKVAGEHEAMLKMSAAPMAYGRPMIDPSYPGQGVFSSSPLTEEGV